MAPIEPIEPIEPIADETTAATVEELKARARRLHRAAAAQQPEALERLRKVPELRGEADAELAAKVRRRHGLWVVARELGFRDWSHALRVLRAPAQVPDFGTLLYPARCSAHWNIWSAHYDEARRIRDEHGGFLLAYKHQFVIVDDHFIETLGLSPADRDWARIGRDWVRPADPAARARLYGQLVRAAA